MTITVSVSELRNNLAQYLELVSVKGDKVVVKDNRKGRVLAELTEPKEKKFNWDKHIKEVKKLGKFLSNQDIKDMKKFRQDVNTRLAQAQKL